MDWCDGGDIEPDLPHVVVESLVGSAGAGCMTLVRSGRVVKVRPGLLALSLLGAGSVFGSALIHYN